METTSLISNILFGHPTVTVLSMIILGCIFGSFINVICYRLPIMMKRQWYADCADLKSQVPFEDTYPKTFNLCLPRSRCTHCDTAIPAYHNIPILSFFWLKGRCHACKKPISKRYPIVEAATAGILTSLYLCMGATPYLLAFAFLGMALITLTLIDLDEMLLPDEIVLPLIWVGLIFNLYTGYVTLEDAVIGACVGYLFLWSVFWVFKILTGKDGMGYGDFKLLAALGAWLGWQMIPLIIVMSSVTGVVMSLPLLLLRKKGMQQAVPFGPYLAAAGWVALLFGQDILSWYVEGYLV